MRRLPLAARTATKRAVAIKLPVRATALFNDYKLLMTATLAVIPLLIVFKQASDGGGEDHTVVME
jgi:hypothetical protein